MKKSYKAYKKTGVAWLPEVPEHWEMLRAKFLFRVIDDKTAKGNEELLSVSEHHGVIPRRNTVVNMFQAESYEGYKLCKKRDLVINSLWAWSRGLGFSEHEGIISNAYSVYRFKIEADHRYYNYLLRTKAYVGEYFVRSKGIWISRLQLSDQAFLDIPIIVPAVDEQKSIADYLDTKTAQIARFIEKKQRLIGLLKEQKAAIIQQALTPEFWKDEVPENEWVRKKLKYVAQNISVQTTAMEEGDIYVGMENIESWTAQYRETEQKDFESQAKSFTSGCILFGKLRPYLAKAFLTPFAGACSGEFLVLKPEREIIPEYLLFLLLKHETINLINSSTFGAKMPRADWKFIGNILLNIPSREVQGQIVNQIQNTHQKTDRIITRTEREIALVKELQQSIIAEAVTGKIKVVAEPAAAPQQKTKTANWEFREAVLISVLTDKYGKPQYPLGRKRYTKLSYLFHRYSDHRTEGYLKKAAGPYNPKTRYGGPEKIALQNHYVKETKAGKFSGFTSDAKIAEAYEYASRYWDAQAFDWLEQFHYKTNDELELLATVDKAVVELRETNTPISLDTVRTFIQSTEEWKAKLKREIFSNENITRAIGLLPTLFKPFV